jgi:hypothetical protein
MGGSGVDCPGTTLDPIQGGSAGGGTAGGGGGGGGGVGRIRINAVTLTNLSTEAIVSPVPSVNVPAITK